jgi:hypothetical protein
MSRAMAQSKTKKIAIACQGGGSHTAFTAGVLSIVLSPEYADDRCCRTSIQQTNAAPRPFVWTKTADETLASISRSCQRTSNSDP